MSCRRTATSGRRARSIALPAEKLHGWHGAQRTLAIDNSASSGEKLAAEDDAQPVWRGGL